ncbi:MAG: TldD/PmbA family protein [Thermococci archaeon]|nr:TldD/PmbA family protein [Thermococci archaeon]
MEIDVDTDSLIQTAEILANRYGIRYYEVRIVEETFSTVRSQNGRIDELSSNNEIGIGIRAFNGAWGFSSANEPSRVEKAIRTAMKIAKLSKQKPERSGIHVGDPIVDRVILKGRKEVPMEEKLSLVRHTSSLLDVDGISNRQVAYMDSTVHQIYFNSVGSFIETSIPRLRFFMAVTAKEGSNMQQSWKSLGGTVGWELMERTDVEGIADEIVRDALSLLKASSPPAGSFDVIMDPELTGVFIHEALGHAAEADSVKTGESILTGKLGEKIGVDGLNVVDDPTLPGKFGSYVYDDEGIPAKRVEIIKDGVLTGYLNNRETSAVLELEPNGHGRAQDYAHQPLVRMGNTFIEPGDWSFEEMIEEMRNGLYMVGDKGGQVDIANGTFTFAAREGYIVENGEIKEKVRDVALSGKILDILKDVRALGRDLRIEYPGYCGKGQWVPVDDGGPHVLTKAIVGGV